MNETDDGYVDDDDDDDDDDDVHDDDVYDDDNDLESPNGGFPHLPSTLMSRCRELSRLLKVQIIIKIQIIMVPNIMIETIKVPIIKVPIIRAKES